MIHLDSSVLIDALTGPKRSAPMLRRLIEGGERIQLTSIVIYEWHRGPRTPEELEDQNALFPTSESIAFGPDEAIVASRSYERSSGPAAARSTSRSRPRPSLMTHGCGR